MRPVVVWANIETETEKASTRQTRPIRTPFDEQRITTSEPQLRWNCMLGHPATALNPKGRNQMTEGIALTRLTRQVVLWSDHKTAGYKSRGVGETGPGISYG